MIKVGLTGGIGVGKTVCSHIFEELGVPIYNSDNEAKRLMVEKEHLKAAIIDVFGEKSYLKNGALNKAHIASIIFEDSHKLSQINQIVHPAVRSDFIEWCFTYKSEVYVIQESALIFESGSYRLFDKTIIVHASDEIRIDRVMKRDKVSRQSVLDRMAKQMPQEEKIELADYVIVNNGEESLIKQIIDIHIDLIEYGRLQFEPV